jgi:hypothetical protein
VLRDTTFCFIALGFGCINRSAVILSDAAISILLKKRPSLRPWRHRDYVVDALWMEEIDFGGSVIS